MLCSLSHIACAIMLAVYHLLTTLLYHSHHHFHHYYDYFHSYNFIRVLSLFIIACVYCLWYIIFVDVVLLVWACLGFRVQVQPEPVSPKMTDLLLGAFFEKVFFPKGAQKNSRKLVCLAGKISGSILPFFCPILNTPNANKTQNSENDRDLI